MSKQRLIDANALYEKLDKHKATIYETGNDRSWTYGDGIRFVMERIENAPTIDAITVSWIEDQIAQHTSETGWTDWWADMCRRFLQEYERRRDDGNAN